MADDLAFLPTTTDAFAAWSFANMAQHRDYNRVIAATYSVTIVEYPLSPIDPERIGNWPWQHQVMHNQTWQAIGGSGYDLTGVDWQNAEYMRQWIAYHVDEHNRISAILGV